MNFRRRFLAFALAVLTVCASADAADAGWIAFKNDTNKSIVVQEFVVVNGRKVTGKPYKLAAGESFREFQNTPSSKRYEILDSASTPLAKVQIPFKPDSQSFSVTNGAKGAIIVMPVVEAKKP